MSSRFKLFCKNAAELASPSADVLRPELSANLGRDISALFPEFAQAFPLTAQVMTREWTKPVAGFSYGLTMWMVDFICQKEELYLFIKPEQTGINIEEDIFDSCHTMLPTKWKELYRWFESFKITTDANRSGRWINTLSSFSGRLNLEEYRQEVGSKKSEAQKFSKLIDCHPLRLMCWMITDAGDALFLDEQRCDHKVYHLRGKNFDDIAILNDPEGLLDEYLAHYLSGGKPADFDFRKNTTPINPRPAGLLSKLLR